MIIFRRRGDDGRQLTTLYYQNCQGKGHLALLAIIDNFFFIPFDNS